MVKFDEQPNYSSFRISNSIVRKLHVRCFAHRLVRGLVLDLPTSSGELFDAPPISSLIFELKFDKLHNEKVCLAHLGLVMWRMIKVACLIYWYWWMRGGLGGSRAACVFTQVIGHDCVFTTTVVVNRVGF